MVIFFIGAIIVLCFVPFIVLAGRRGEAEKRMAARFAILQSSIASDLSNAAVDNLLKHSQEEENTWHGRLLGRLSTAIRLNELLLQSDTSIAVKQFFAVSMADGIVALLTTYLLCKLWFVACFAALVAGYLPLGFLKYRRQKRTKAMEKVLPEVVDMMTRALRAGHSLSASIGIIAEQAPQPARTEFAEVFRKQKFGHPLRDALVELLARTPSQDLRVLVTGILVQRDTGGNLTQILERTSAVVRERLKLQGDVRVHTAQGRMTGWVLCLLPIAMLLIINMVDPGYSKLLTEDPFGRKCLYAGLVLLAVGAMAIKRIVNGIEV
jgi:tight adherence protein B